MWIASRHGSESVMMLPRLGTFFTPPPPSATSRNSTPLSCSPRFRLPLDVAGVVYDLEKKRREAERVEDGPQPAAEVVEARASSPRQQDLSLTWSVE